MISRNKLILLINLILLVLFNYCGSNVSEITPIITGENTAIAETKYGKVRGYIHNNIYTYKGIPYARAERFMPPEKPKKWVGIRSSMAYGPVCPMMSSPSVTSDEGEFVFQHDWGYSDEDCLRLNIWTPGIADNADRSVMVWIHGGGYSYGSSQELPSYDGENISKKGDIVLVSVNHRLNILGFTDLSAFGDKYKYSANAGMLDLVTALKWIKNNIKNFGGNPNNVTIFGQSGGGGKVGTLMNAPSAKGLFHRAIIQSGANPEFQDQKITKKIGKTIVSELGLSSSNIDSIQKVPYSDLVDAAQRAFKKVREQLVDEGKNPSGYGFGMSPTLDGEFLPYKPTNQKALALTKDIPLMIGSTKNEFITSLWRNPNLYNSPLDTIVNFIEKKYGEKTEEYIAAVKKAYPNDIKPTDLIDVDLQFRRTTIKHSNLKSSNSRAPVFMYLFTWQSPVLNGKYKSIHCMELPFVFNNIARCEEMTGGYREAYLLADKVSTAWIKFAYNGDPNHEGLPEWQAYNKENGACMILDNKSELRYHHDKDLLKITENEPSMW